MRKLVVLSLIAGLLVVSSCRNFGKKGESSNVDTTAVENVVPVDTTVVETVVDSVTVVVE